MKHALLGASRGLGWAYYQYLCEVSPEAHILMSARKKPADLREQDQFLVRDFSKISDQTSLIEQMSSFDPEILIYFAGGGPYGRFEQKDWKDHQWALEVSFLFPARLLHSLLKLKPTSALQTLVFVGSSVAEAKADPKAASYAAAKHALRGLITTVRAEQPSLDLRLFSPGYMDTELLPPNAEARRNPEAEISSPQNMAQALAAFLKNPDSSGHFSHP